MIQFFNFYETMKPRVMYLSIFTSFCALMAAYNYNSIQPDLFSVLFTVLFISLGAGASGALNMWWDADIDRDMTRTKNRPIPSGKLSEHTVLIFGLLLSFLSISGLFFVRNFLSASLLAFTIFFYVVIYSMILKRTTPQNIVIGGAAGALPPVVAWSAVTGDVTIQAILFFFIIFFWTPPHFWSLSIFSNDDYKKVNIPMLTVTHGVAVTTQKIIKYTFLTVLSVLAYFYFIGNMVAFGFAALLSADFVRRVYELHFTDSKEFVAKNVFFFSIIYLFSIFFLILIDSIFNMLTTYL